VSTEATPSSSLSLPLPASVAQNASIAAKRSASSFESFSIATLAQE
jgi:hypothetical protein